MSLCEDKTMSFIISKAIHSNFNHESGDIPLAQLRKVFLWRSSNLHKKHHCQKCFRIEC